MPSPSSPSPSSVGGWLPSLAAIVGKVEVGTGGNGEVMMGESFGGC